jgi:hypothetical protein
MIGRKSGLRSGYARVSTVGQTLEAQLDGLWAAGCHSNTSNSVDVVRAPGSMLARLMPWCADNNRQAQTKTNKARMDAPIGMIQVQLRCI